MSKRKKLRTSAEENLISKDLAKGREGIHPPKPPKNSRPGNINRAPQISELDSVLHPEETPGKSGPTPSAEPSWGDLAQVASSSMDEETGVPLGFLTQLEKDSVPFPLSQNSAGKFVPQFAKSRKTVSRKAETRGEDFGTQTFHLETPPEPRASQIGSQALDESLGPAILEAAEPGYDTRLEQSSQTSGGKPVPCLGDAAASASTPQEGGPGPSDSWSADQEHLSEQQVTHPSAGGNVGNSRPEAERGLASGDVDQKGHLLRSKACGAPEEEGEGVPGAPVSASAQGPCPATQGPPNNMQTPSQTGGEAEWSCPSSQRCSFPDPGVITTMSTEPSKPGQRGPEEADPSGRKAADGGYRGAPLSSSPLTGERTGGWGEPGQEESLEYVLAGPTTPLAPTHRNREPTVDAVDSSPQASETGPGVQKKLVPGPSQEGPGDKDAQPSLAEPTGAKAAEVGSKSHKQNLALEKLRLCFWATWPPERGEARDSHSWESEALQGSPDPHAGLAVQPNPTPTPADQPSWGGCSTVELSFLPDSQIRDVLDAPNLEVLPEQVQDAVPSILATHHAAATATCRLPCAPPETKRPAGDQGQPPSRPQWSGSENRPVALEPSGMHTSTCQKQCPVASRPSPRWPGPSLPAHRDPEAQPRNPQEAKICEASRMEDATETVCGLVMELSNLKVPLQPTLASLQPPDHGCPPGPGSLQAPQIPEGEACRESP
ncbi:break repair meiotic recombinase recruitment factor 1 isoform X2 [Tamandua tetradactyla]|uniref:break repair meiotic recombinase recruitment factor 1 isoform X2 n=1 Tax=Tamandua tetradactyla TaxID=48850 RepID=UPI004053ECCE